MSATTEGQRPFNNKAYKKLERLRQRPGGCSFKEVNSLLLGFGFVRDERTNHTMYYDPEDPDNVVMVPRHRKIREYVVRDAVACIDKMLQRKETNND